MAINYIPNDPMAAWANTPVKKTPRADRPSGVAGFDFKGAEPEATYSPGTEGFLYWQCRDAALATLAAWEKVDGTLRRWSKRRNLNVYPNRGQDLNAYYDRRDLGFFESTDRGKTTYSGASVDVVAHELGHALLDAIRPDLWSSSFLEVNAFHEAFGDCMALVSALADKKQRQELISQVPDLWDENFIESWGEDLADGVRRAWGAQELGARPRHAFNWFDWQLPASLPTSGRSGQLVAEYHIFGQIFTGCFYDLIAALWNEQPSWSDTALRQAAETATKLLIEGTRTALEHPRFFQSVGEAMLGADQRLSNGANQAALRQAFQGHSVVLGAPQGPTPFAALSGSPPRVTARTARVTPATRRELTEFMGAPTGTRLSVRSLSAVAPAMAEVTVKRDVPLTGLSERLAGVVAVASQPVMLGRAAGRAALLSAPPQPAIEDEEVRFYVDTLLQSDAIAFDGDTGGARAVPGGKTHQIDTRRDGSQVLVRTQFGCACG